MNSSNNKIYSLFAILLLLGSNAAYANVAGHVQFVNGVVQLTDPAGKTRSVQKGDAVNEGDTLTSAKNASAQIKMQDGGLVAMRADTRLKFDSFIFSGKQDGTEQSFFSLFKGGFRAVTGLIGQINKPSYRIITPAATIGIRGTDHETFMVAPDSELAAVAPPGAYNKVNLGETYLATEKGTIFVLPNQMGYAGAKDQMPQLQPINTNLFTVAPGPAPQAEGDKQEAKEEAVRETAVVDNTAQEQVAPPAPAAAAPENTVAPNIIQLPVETTGGTNLTGGGGTLAGSPAYAAQNGYGYEALGVDALGMWINPWDSNLPASSYLLDAANNLFEVVGGINPGKVAGGVAKDTYVAADSSVYMGRWEGGTYTDSTTMIPVAMGATSMQWMLSANPPVGYVQTLMGTTNYSLTAATHPTDKLGNVGTLTAATLTADFTNQMVNISLALAFSTADPNFISTHNKAFTVTTPGGISILGETVWGLGTVACTGANCDAGGYTADIWARFAANAADKVGIPYNIIGNTTDLVQGVALVTAATAPAPVAPPGAVAPYVQTDKAAAFVTAGQTFNPPFLEINSGILRQGDINNTLPNPSFTDRNAGKDPGSYITYTLSGTTTAAETSAVLANGIQFGRYDSSQSTKLVVGTTNCCAAGTYTSPGPVYSHWIIGPAVDPVYLPEVLLATATYTFAGGTTPTATSLSTPPVVTLSSASLAVNFTQQLVSFNLALSNGWSAGTAGTPLEFTYWSNAKTGFRATTLGYTGWGVLTASNGAGAIIGDVTGQLTGNGLDGALLSYHLRDTTTEITGVAAFTGTAQAAPSYRLAGLSTTDPNPPASAFPNGQYPVGGVVPIPVTLGGYNNTASVTMDGAGNLTGFRSDAAYADGGVYNISKGVAVATGLGNDPVSGISWGRWGGSSFTSTNVATGAPGISNTGSAHWIASPVLTGPVTLPVTGTFNYVLAGGTAPTDSLGGVGTLNSASLAANFTAQTVSVGLNVTTPNAGNLIAGAANLPIQQKSFFEAATAGAIQGGGTPGSLTLTCGAGCTGTPQGNVVGVFTGAGGLGAAVLYGFAAGANNTTIVNGVAAFHR